MRPAGILLLVGGAAALWYFTRPSQAPQAGSLFAPPPLDGQPDVPAYNPPPARR